MSKLYSDPYQYLKCKMCKINKTSNTLFIQNIMSRVKIINGSVG